MHRRHREGGDEEGKKGRGGGGVLETRVWGWEVGRGREGEGKGVLKCEGGLTLGVEVDMLLAGVQLMAVVYEICIGSA